MFDQKIRFLINFLHRHSFNRDSSSVIIIWMCVHPRRIAESVAADEILLKLSRSVKFNMHDNARSRNLRN